MSDSASFRARSSWSASAKRTFREVSAAHPTLEKSKLSILYAACDLLSEADSMQRRIDADGLMATGSQGQPVANPLIAEVRQYRKTALDALRALGLEGKGAASAAGAALAGKRWASRPAKAHARAAAGDAPF